MVGVCKAAVLAVLVALACGGAALGAAGYTGPVAGVPWSPDALPAATVGVPYSASVTPAPAGATQLAVACNTRLLTGFPPPPVALDQCGKLPPGVTATGGSSLGLSGTPTADGTYSFRLIAVWTDATGADFYALKSYTITVSSTSASPPCRCSSVGASVTKLSFAGKSATVDVVLSLKCTSGSGSFCNGTAIVHAPARAGAKTAWTSFQRPGDDRPQPVTKRGATVGLSCVAPCGHGATVPIRLRLSGAALTTTTRRAGTRWTIVVVPACAGQSARQKALTLQFDARGRLDLRRSRLS